jgi:hypothetical protein
VPTRCTRDEAGRQSTSRCTPLVRALALHGVSENSGSHLGSTLNPGGAVLTLGVSRRSRSVAYIRADASPSEVLASAIVPPTATRVKLTRKTALAVDGQTRCDQGHQSGETSAEGLTGTGSRCHHGPASTSLSEASAPVQPKWLPAQPDYAVQCQSSDEMGISPATDRGPSERIPFCACIVMHSHVHWPPGGEAK